MHKRKEQREPVSTLTIVKALLAIEAISLLIALAVTFGPSRT